MRHRAAACLIVAVVAAGCGGERTARQPPAPPFSARVLASGTVPRVRPADFRKPTAVYRRHVRAELGAMLADVATLRAALAAGRPADAKRAWLAADAHYETIGAAYGAFGELDAAINGRPAGLEGGVRSRDFTGLHRIELALWGRGSTRDAIAPAAALTGDVRALRAKVATMKIDPLEYSLRAHEVLEDSLHLQLSGQASPWSGAALTALRANIRGTRVVLGSLDALIARRNPRVLQRARASLTTLSGALSDLADGRGALPRWDALGQRERERIDGLTAAATEQLAFVPELVDPRPPRAIQQAFGDSR
jgi:iron uptake system EfeUOB component EfeO/EfeM